jgi:hypothetical protein
VVLGAFFAGLPVYSGYVAQSKTGNALGYPLTGGSFMQVVDSDAGPPRRRRRGIPAYHGCSGGRSGMQFIESSIIGLRSAVTTFTRPATPLRFILFPMVHVGEQQFYDEVAARARLCQVIVAEGTPSQFVPAQEWMAQQRWGPFVDQVAALRLESLGVPVCWEATPDHRPKNETGIRPNARTGKRDGYRSGNRPKSPAEDLISRVTDVVGAATLGLARKFIDPRILDSVDQAETYDESAGNLTGGWFDRNFEYNVRTVRDARLTGRLDEIHRDRAVEPVNAGVVFGAAHMPAVAAHLCGKLGYIAASSEWLTVAHGKS